VTRKEKRPQRSLSTVEKCRKENVMNERQRRTFISFSAFNPTK
jgi:hypothetical protein